MIHHKNPELYYKMALLTFKFLEDYKNAMVFFNKAIEFDPNLRIPEEIKSRYDEYSANRSGVGVKVIVSMNESNLRYLIPKRDKITLSTQAFAVVAHMNMSGSKKIIHEWKTHLLLSNNGIAFKGAKPMCKKPTYYIPWTSVAYHKKPYFFIIPPEVSGIKYRLTLSPLLDSQTKSLKYIEDMNLFALLDVKLEDLIKRTEANLKLLDPLPSFKEYIKIVEYIPKKTYKKIIRTIIQNRA